MSKTCLDFGAEIKKIKTKRNPRSSLPIMDPTIFVLIIYNVFLYAGEKDLVCLTKGNYSLDRNFD